MDSVGARLLASRIAAGVRIGSVIELERDVAPELHAGDRGTVRDVVENGRMIVVWDRGFAQEVDPAAIQFRALTR
jgi:hypothetical protein